MPQPNQHAHLHTYVYIALGSNATSLSVTPSETLKAAISHLNTDSVLVTATSRYYSTPAFPEGSGPPFVNAVIQVSTELSPDALLARLHAIEKKFGRVRQKRWAARSLDLDLIAYENRVIPSGNLLKQWIDLPVEEQMNRTPEQLLLPHPRLQDRSFMLVPLCDLAPDWRHPVLNRTAQELLDARPEVEKNQILVAS